MPNFRFAASLLLAAAAVPPLASAQAASTGAGAPNYRQERAERAQELTRPYGWFSLVALEWLKPGLTTVGSARDNTLVLPGAPAHLATLAQNDGKVAVVAADPSLRYRGAPVQTAGGGAVIAEDEEDDAALSSGSLRLWVIDRGGKRYLRVKDAEAPARKHFQGLRWYAPDPRLRVQARWIPYTTPHTLRFLNQLGQQSDEPEPGYVEFSLDGRKVTLTPLSATGDSLWFVFRDTTSPRITDGGGRFLYTGPPSNGLHQRGTVVLDFNQAVNPPCAYSPFATCPLAAPENRLPVAVSAGEKRYSD